MLSSIDNAMANPFFSGRIPQELYEKAESHCKENGESKTDLLIKALSSYLNFPVEIQRPSYAQFQQAVTKEEFESLTARVDYLEKMLGNKGDDIVSDNICDNTDENEKDKTFSNDITVIINDNKTESANIYGSITSKQLSEIANITSPEITNLKNQAFNKAAKLGYVITEDIKFNPFIEMTFKKGITIEDTEHKLYCKGIDENKKPVWMLERYDNNSYQLNIT